MLYNADIFIADATRPEEYEVTDFREMTVEESIERLESMYNDLSDMTLDEWNYRYFNASFLSKDAYTDNFIVSVIWDEFESKRRLILCIKAEDEGKANDLIMDILKKIWLSLKEEESDGDTELEHPVVE